MKITSEGQNDVRINDDEFAESVSIFSLGFMIGRCTRYIIQRSSGHS